MTVDTDYGFVRLLVQGNNLNNGAIERLPTSPLYATTSVIGSAVPGADHVALDGKLSADMVGFETLSLTVSDLAPSAGTGTSSTQTSGGTFEVVVEVNQAWPIGATIAELAGIKFTIESPGLIRITGSSQFLGVDSYQTLPDTRTVFVGTDTVQLYIVVAGLSYTYYSQVGADFSITPRRNVGDPYRVRVVKGDGTQVFSGFSRSGLYDARSASVGNAFGPGEEIAASPAEYSVSVVRHQAGYLPSTAYYPYIYTLSTVAGSAPLTSGSMGVTATAKNTSGVVMGVYSATTPLSGLNIAQAASICLANIAAQLPAQGGLSAAISDVQGVGGSIVRLQLPIRGNGWTWEVAATGLGDPSPATYSISIFPGAYSFGAGLPEIFEVILTKGDPSSITNYNIKRTNRSHNATPSTFTISTNGRILDTAIEDVRSSLLAGIGVSNLYATTLITAPFANQRGVRMTVPATPLPAWFSNGGLAGAFEWGATKIDAVPTGATKLYRMRVTGLRDRLINLTTPSEFPTLPWPTSGIPPVTPFVVGPATWDPAWSLGNTDLSNGDRTSGIDNFSDGSDRTTVGKTSGIWYFEVDAASAPYSAVDVIGTSFTRNKIFIDPYLASHLQEISVAWQTTNGDIYVNGQISGSGLAISTPNIVGIEFNADTRQVRFHNTNGASAQRALGGTGAMYGAHSFNAIGTVTSSATINAGQFAFVYGLPSGALPLGGSTVFADVAGAGYNDIDALNSYGVGNTQDFAPDIYGNSLATLDDITSDVTAYIDAADVTGTGATTLGAFTNSGAGVAATPTNLNGANLFDDFTSTGDGVADLPFEFTANYSLEDFTSISVGLFLAPSEGSGDAALDEFFISAFSYTVETPSPMSAAITLPVFQVAGIIVDSVANVAEITLPVFEVAGHFGMGAEITLPTFSVAASGTVANVLRASIALPVFQVQGIASVAGQATANIALPRFQVAGYFGAGASIALPAWTANGVLTVGSVLNAAIKLPLFEVGGYISQPNTLRAEITLPALLSGGFTAARITLPTWQVAGVISQQQVIAYESYVMQMSPKAAGETVDQVTRYTSFPFTQVVRYGSLYYGVGVDGLYRLDGNTDNGTPINWSFETCLTDFGTAQIKNVESTFVGGDTGTTVNYTIKAGDSVDQLHVSTTGHTGILRNHRQKYGRGRKARYYALGIAGQGDLAIDSIEFEVATTSRRI